MHFPFHCRFLPPVKFNSGLGIDVVIKVTNTIIEKSDGVKILFSSPTLSTISSIRLRVFITDAPEQRGDVLRDSHDHCDLQKKEPAIEPAVLQTTRIIG